MRWTNPGLNGSQMRSLLISLLFAFSLSAQAQSIKVLVQSSPLAGFQYYAAVVHWDEMKEIGRAHV